MLKRLLKNQAIYLISGGGHDPSGAQTHRNQKESRACTQDRKGAQNGKNRRATQGSGRWFWRKNNASSQFIIVMSSLVQKELGSTTGIYVLFF